jgi:hypothetical protein
MECERNIANRLTKGGLLSMALFRDTEVCPLYDKETKHNKDILRQIKTEK